MRFIFFILAFLHSLGSLSQAVTVGAKHFNEGYILGEILAQLLESEGYQVQRKFNLGGTSVCYEALRNKAIDVYPEYTGSLAREILKSDQALSFEQLSAEMNEKLNLGITPSFGFNNTYALAVRKDFAEKHGIEKISDLKQFGDLTAAMSYEFLKRQDGWENLKREYELEFQPVGIEHGLAYEALNNGGIDLTDVYSTDGEIQKFNLFVLADDLEFFPSYQGVAVYHEDVDSKVIQILARLTGLITEEEMQAMNARTLFEKKTFQEVAREFLVDKKIISDEDPKVSSSMWEEIGTKTIEHLALTTVSLGLAILFAVPLGVLLYMFSSMNKPVLYFVGLLQTIPSIALLALMIPLLGIGKVPATTALFLYALLPVLRNTTTGLNSVDPILKKVATGMGMTRWQQLRLVELPLAMPTVLAGVRTAAVITIGTATLAAFIGAGGLGEFIVTGLALNNTSLILQGAIPAAVLAIVVEFGFELGEKILIPKHLQKSL